MRLQALRITNVAHYDDVIWRLAGEPIVLLYGANWGGKSVVADSIQWLLSATVPGLPARIEQHTPLIRPAADTMTVEASWVDRHGEIVRMRRNLGPQGHGYMGHSLPEDLRVPVSFLCHGESLVAKDATIQREILFAAADPRIRLEDLVKVLPLTELPESKRPPSTDPDFALNRAQVESIYQWAYDTRRDVRRDLNAVRPVEPVSWGPGGRPDLAKLSKDLETQKARHTELTLQEGQQGGAMVEKARQYGEIAKELSELDGKLDGAPTDDATLEEIAADGRRAAASRAEQEAWAKEYGAWERHRREREGLLAGLRASYAMLQNAEACPTCLQKFPSAQERSVVLLNISKRMAELEEDAPGEAPPQPAVYEPRTAKLEAELTARRAQTARRAKLLSEAETLRAQGVKPSAAAQPVSSAAAARTKALTELEAKVTAARDALGRESAYQESILARDRLSRRLEALQAACEFLAPKGGALDQALGRAMDGILSDANELLQGWGMSLRLQEDPFGLYLRDHDVNLPLTRASSSQQWLISAVLAIAIAVPLGWRTIVLDGADILRGPENKSRLPSLLSEAARRELMLIVTTADPPPTEIARVAGVERWQIVAGERGPAFVPIDREKEVP